MVFYRKSPEECVYRSGVPVLLKNCGFQWDPKLCGTSIAVDIRDVIEILPISVMTSEIQNGPDKTSKGYCDYSPPTLGVRIGKNNQLGLHPISDDISYVALREKEGPYVEKKVKGKVVKMFEWVPDILPSTIHFDKLVIYLHQVG